MDIIRKIKNEINGVISIYKTGSQLITTNNNDLDYIVIVEEGRFFSHMKIDGACIFVWHKDAITYRLNEVDAYHRQFLLTFLFEDALVYGEKQNYEITEEHIAKIKEVLPKIHNLIKPDGTYIKGLWWLLLPLIMWEKGLTKIDKQLIEIAEACYSGTLDPKWLDFIKSKFPKNQLNNKLNFEEMELKKLQQWFTEYFDIQYIQSQWQDNYRPSYDNIMQKQYYSIQELKGQANINRQKIKDLKRIIGQ